MSTENKNDEMMHYDQLSYINIKNMSSNTWPLCLQICFNVWNVLWDDFLYRFRLKDKYLTVIASNEGECTPFTFGCYGRRLLQPIAVRLTQTTFFTHNSDVQLPKTWRFDRVSTVIDLSNKCFFHYFPNESFRQVLKVTYHLISSY